MSHVDTFITEFYNKNHSRANGRFTTGPSGGGYNPAPHATRVESKATRDHHNRSRAIMTATDGQARASRGPDSRAGKFRLPGSRDGLQGKATEKFLQSTTHG